MNTKITTILILLAVILVIGGIITLMVIFLDVNMAKGHNTRSLSYEKHA